MDHSDLFSFNQVNQLSESLIIFYGEMHSKEIILMMLAKHACWPKFMLANMQANSLMRMASIQSVMHRNICPVKATNFVFFKIKVIAKFGLFQISISF